MHLNSLMPHIARVLQVLYPPITIPYMSDIEVQYNKALDYLYSFVDYSLKHSFEIATAELNLDCMYALMEELGNLQNKYSVIHVAGAKVRSALTCIFSA